jgi:hypothetical protein
MDKKDLYIVTVTWMDGTEERFEGDDVNEDDVRYYISKDDVGEAIIPLRNVKKILVERR